MNWIEEFTKYLYTLNANELQIEKGFELKAKNLPERLFKFRSGTNRDISNLSENKIWLADPNSFNDPYDCHHFINFQKLQNETIRLILPRFQEILTDEQFLFVEKNIANTDKPLDLLLDALWGDADADIRSSAGDLWNKTISKEFEKMAKAGDKLKEGFKLCSFSERKDSTLMWAHYANDHKGFCIEYDIKSISPEHQTSRLMFPVIYQDNVFDATECIPLSKTDNFNNLYLNQAALIKGTDWSYEKEWRLVFANSYFSKSQTWGMPVPTAIYLGSHISANDQGRIQEICISKDIQMFKMQHSRSHYEMTAIPL